MTTTATPARIATLIDWAVSNGAVLHPDIQVYQDPITGFSFQVKPTAAKPLPGDYSKPIVRLPASLSLSYLNAISTEGPGSPLSEAILNSSATSERLPPHVIGRLFLIKDLLGPPTILGR
ncbi:hypothetical protein NQ176_g8991 [Zarea fungicola]|uniref:Uncharacterized protein n=1 Tax=Zarea fungicola TaxID=93591 RepID=A0ACC1MQ68_9HYPO|nr:hypothetical protein NQ176_g8991 [Lecanicillium fungicola]